MSDPQVIDLDNPPVIDLDAPDKARVQLLATDPEAKDKLAIADHFSRLGMNPRWVYNTVDGLSKALYGTEMKAKEFFGKVKGSWDSWQIGDQIDKLRVKQIMGDKSEETQKQIDELDQKMPKDRLSTVPDAILNQFYQMGKVAQVTGEEALVQQKRYSGPGHMILNMAHGLFGGAKEFETQIAGGTYHELKETKDDQGRPISDGIAKATALTLSGIITALMVVPYGKALEPFVSKLGTEVAVKLTLGGIVKRAAVMGMTQGSFAAANALATEGAKEIAKSVNNRVNGTSFTSRDAWQFLHDAGIEFLTQTGAGMVLATPGLITENVRIAHGGRLEGAVKEAVAQTGEEAHPITEVEPVPAAVTKETQAFEAERVRGTLGDVLDEMNVRREAGEPRANPKTVAKIRKIIDLDTSDMASDAVVDELRKAVSENKDKPLFRDYSYKLAKAERENDLRKAIEAVRERFAKTGHPQAKLQELADIHRAILNGTAPGTFRQEDLARMEDLWKIPLRLLPEDSVDFIYDILSGAKHLAVNADKVLVKQNRVDKSVARETMIGEMKDTGLQDETFWTRAKVSLNSYQTLIQKIFGGEKSTGYDVHMRRIDDGVEASSTFKRDRFQPFADWMKEKKHGERWFTEKIKVGTYEMSRGQVMAINGLLSQENGLDSLKNEFRTGRRKRDIVRGAPDEFFQEVQGKMDGDMKDFLGLVFNLGRQNGVDLKAAFMRMNGYEGRWLEQYYPFHRVRGASLEEDMVNDRLESNQTFLPGNWDGNNFRATIERGHVIPRVDSQAGLWVRNVLDDVLDSIDFAGDYVHLAEPVRNAAKMLWDGEFSLAIEDRYGKEAVKALRNGLRAAAGNRDQMQWMDSLVMGIRRKGIRGVLGFNIPNAALNRSLMLRAFAFGVPMKDMARATAEMVAHPVETRRWWDAHSALAHDLLSKGTMMEFQQAEPARSRRVLRKITDISMAPERWGFSGAALNEMQGSFNQAMREFSEGKMSENVKTAIGREDVPPEADREAAAIRYAEWVTKRTHAVPRELYQSNLSRSGTIGRLASTLYSERSALLQMGMRILNSGSPRTAAHFMRYLTVGVLGEALVIAGIRYAYDQGREIVMDELTGKKDRGGRKPQTFLVHAAEELASQVGGLVPEGSNLVYAGERVVEGLLTKGRQPTPQVSLTLMSDTANSIIRMVQDVGLYVKTRNDAKKTQAAIRAVNEFLSVVLPYGAGIAYSHGLRDILYGVERKVTGKNE